MGTAVALRWVPRGWQGRFRTFDRGLKPGVSLAAGAACEGALSFLINLVVLWSLATRCGCTPRCTRAVKSPFCVLPQCACGARRVFMQTEEWACKRRCRPGPPSSALRRRKRLGYVAPLAATVMLARPARAPIGRTELPVSTQMLGASRACARWRLGVEEVLGWLRDTAWVLRWRLQGQSAGQTGAGPLRARCWPGGRPGRR